MIVHFIKVCNYRKLLYYCQISNTGLACMSLSFTYLFVSLEKHFLLIYVFQHLTYFSFFSKYSQDINFHTSAHFLVWHSSVFVDLDAFPVTACLCSLCYRPGSFGDRSISCFPFVSFTLSNTIIFLQQEYFTVTFTMLDNSIRHIAFLIGHY